MERWMKIALENRSLVLLLVLLILGVGLLSVRHLAIDAFPDVTSVQVEVLSNAPGLSPLEIEKFVTFPIENTMRGLPGLAEMRSVTKYGLSVITLVFEDRTDIYFARQLVFERLASVEKQLPEGVSSEMGPIATAMGEVYQYTLEDRRPLAPDQRIARLTEHRTLQDRVIVPALKSIPGVNDINSFGGYRKEFHVVADSEKLRKYDLSMQDLFASLQENNKNVGGGFIDQGAEQFIIRGVGLIAGESDIGNIVLKAHGGIPIFVRDVAEVRTSYAPRQGLALRNGREAVGGIVMMLKGENSLEVVRRVEARVGEINGGTLLPPGVRLEPYYVRSEIVGQSIQTVTRALIEGSLLVVAVLYLLLRNLRGALAVLLALPLSLLLTFAVMNSLGLSANLMSLGGLAISIGMIIDTTIIQVENVQRHLSEKKGTGSGLSAVLHAVLEVRKPSIFGELIIALTFLPIVTLEGMEGKMFSPLAFTVAVALLSSLFLSVFVIPVLCSLLLRPGDEKDNLLLRLLKKGYLPQLRAGMRMPLLVFFGSLALMACGAWLAPQLGTEFIPVMDEGAFDMDIQLLPGVSLDKSGQIATLVHERLMRFPELTTLVSRTGQTGIALEARGVDKTGFTGLLRPRSEWKSAVEKEELIEKMRHSLEDIPGMAFSFSQPIQCRIDELVAGTRAQLIAKIYGDDLEVLKKKVSELGRILSGIRGVADLVVEKVSGQPYITVEIDRTRLARYGVNVAEALRLVEIAVGGKSATQVFEGNQAIDLVVRLAEKERNSILRIGNLLIPANDGATVPLNQVADLRVGEGPVQISRENGQRRMGVEINLENRDIGSFVAEAQQAVREKLRLPTGYALRWGGQFENQQAAMRRLMVITPAVLALILVLLYVTFHDLFPALLVFLNLPFALVGGVLALWASGLYLSVSASVGFIVLLGVAVLNGLVLVSYIVQLRKDGAAAREAVERACDLRLRPILMTATITVFSLVPMLYTTGPGSEIQKPLAVVVVGGLFTSTMATLLVLPSMYTWFSRHPKVAPKTAGSADVNRSDPL